MGLDSVLTTIGNAVATATNAAGITQGAQTFKGWPTSTQLVDLLAQVNINYVVSIYPMPARNATRWLDQDAYYVPPDVTLVASVTDSQTLNFALTGGTTMVNAYNVHSFIKGVNADILVQPATTDGVDNVATEVAAAVNALAVAGLSAAASGANVVLTGGQWQFCNVGGTGLYNYEGTRIARPVQVSIWTTGDTATTIDPDRSLRLAVYDAIVGLMGTKGTHFYTDPTDGTPIFLLYGGDDLDDESQSSYNLYVARILFEMEYSVNASLPATQVGAAIITETLSTGLGPTTRPSIILNLGG